MPARRTARPKKVTWEEFERRYRSPKGVGRGEEARQFIESIEPGTALEFTIPEGVSEGTARTTLYAEAKRLGVVIQITTVGMEEGKLLVGRPPE